LGIFRKYVEKIQVSLKSNKNNEYSAEIPTRCNLVTEFIIPKLIEGLTCFERHTAHHQELLTVFAASGLYTHVVTGCCQGRGNSRTPHGHINQRRQIKFIAPDDERCAA